jgi:hypothetical protein
VRRGQRAGELALVDGVYQYCIKLSHSSARVEERRKKYTPMWLCIMRLAPRSSSRRDAGEQKVTKAAVVSGTRPAARRHSKDQRHEPWDLDGGGKVVGSFTVPLYIASQLPKN